MESVYDAFGRSLYSAYEAEGQVRYIVYDSNGCMIDMRETPPDPPDPGVYHLYNIPERYGFNEVVSPTAGDRAYKGWSYDNFVAAYDHMMSLYPSYITEIVDNEESSTAGKYCCAFIFTPENYTHTVYIEAGVHSSEKMALCVLTRWMQTLCSTDPNGDGDFSVIRRTTRVIINPCVNPAMSLSVGNNRPAGGDGNASRDCDGAWTHISGYNYPAPFQLAETRWIRDVIAAYSPELVLDLHDAANPPTFGDYWFYYQLDNPEQGPVVLDVLRMLEEADGKTTHATPHVTESYTFGNVANYTNRNLGIPGGTVEFCYPEGDFSPANVSAAVRTGFTMLNAQILSRFHTAPYFSADNPYKIVISTATDTKYLNGRDNNPFGKSRNPLFPFTTHWDELISANASKISKSTVGDSTVITMGRGEKHICVYTGGAYRYQNGSPYLTDGRMWELASVLLREPTDVIKEIMDSITLHIMLPQSGSLTSDYLDWNATNNPRTRPAYSRLTAMCDTFRPIAVIYIQERNLISLPTVSAQTVWNGVPASTHPHLCDWRKELNYGSTGPHDLGIKYLSETIPNSLRGSYPAHTGIAEWGYEDNHLRSNITVWGNAAFTDAMRRVSERINDLGLVGADVYTENSASVAGTCLYADKSVPVVRLCEAYDNVRRLDQMYARPSSTGGGYDLEPEDTDAYSRHQYETGRIISDWLILLDELAKSE